MPLDPGSQGAQRNVDVNLRSNVDQYVTGMNQAEVSTSRVAAAVDALDQKVVNLGKRIQGGLVRFSERDFAALTVGVAAAATYDKQLSTLNATAAVTRQNFSGIKGAVEGAFTSLPTSRTNIIQLIETLDTLGVTGAKQLGQLAQTFIKLGAATGEGPNELAQGLVQLSRLMGTTDAGRIAQYANSLLTVSKNAGVSATGVLQFAQAIAPMARQAGIGQAAVLGISAAFSKAGADGFVAANTFNSMVSDITKLIQTGSPDLAKYANLIGVTSKQFRSMDKTNALVDIFETINKEGPNAINTLNRLGIDGVRAQAAISAVVQSGDLRDQISKSLGSSGDTKNLNRGAHAAMNDLADQLARVRNELTQFGTQIGETFVGPLKVAASVAADLLHVLTELTKPFAPLLAMFGALAGAVAGVSGAVAGISHVVLAGGALALLARSGPGKALREGLAVGRGGPLEGNASAAMYAGGKMPLRARIPYVIGRGAGEALGPRGVPGEGPGALRTAARTVVRAPGMLLGGTFRSQRRFLADAAERDPYSRSAYAGAMGGAEGAAAKRSLREWASTTMAANKASAANEGTVKAFSKTMWDATKEVAKFGVQTAKTGASLLTGGRVGGGPAPVVEEGSAARAAGTMGALGRAGRGVGSLLGGIGPLGYGLLAASFAPSIIGSINSHDNAAFKVDDGNAISKYDQLLGQTSTNLAKFSDAVTDASKSAQGFAGKSLDQAAQIGPQDVATATSGYKVTDSNFTKLAKRSPHRVGTPVAYIQGLAVQHGGMDAPTLHGIQQDLIATYGKDQAQKILNAYMATNPGGSQSRIDYGSAAKGVNAQGSGKDFRKIVDQFNSDIISQSQVAPGKRSSQAELKSLVSLLAPTLASDQVGGNEERVKHARALLAKNFGGNASDYGTDLTSRDNSNVEQKYDNPAEVQARIVQAIGRSKQGRQFLKNAGVDVGSLYNGAASTTSIGSLLSRLSGQFPNAQSSELSTKVRGTNALGAFAEGSSTVQAGVAHPGDPNAQYAGMMSLYQSAGGGNRGFDKVTAAFDQLTSTIGDTTDQLYIMSRAAKAYAQQQEQYALPFMSRSQQFGQVSADYRQAKLTQASTPSPDSAADLQQSQAAYQQQLQSQQQYELSVYQQSRSFGVQMHRSEQDFYLQRFRSQRDFQIQSLQSEQDYEISRERQMRDHDRQLAQQAMTSAQSIYNPMQRVQPVPTNGGGTLAFNLGDQNARLRRQRSELDALEKAGLSIQAIQVLDLANPNNAQQLDRLMMDVRDDPSLISQYNAQTATRVKLTKKLTQNTDNLGFAQSQQNFQLGLSDAAKDFDRQRQRAIDAQNRALSDMENDYNRMVRRAGQDLTMSMTELYGSFADNYDKTLSEINKSIGKYAPQLAQTLTKELKQVHDAINATVAGTAPQSTAKTANNGGDRLARKGLHAMGVISTVQHDATISEGNRPEMVLPLDSRGQQFMAGMYQGITSHLVKTLNARGYGARGRAGEMAAAPSEIHVDQSTNFTGPLSVQAQDVNDMLRQLEAKARLAKLSSPGPSGR